MLALQEVLQQLQEMGTEQNRKTYRRHGIGEDMYGVSYANLGTLKKRIKTNHALAQQLWASGNHDARILATMIADPQQMDAETISAWLADVQNHVVTDALVGLVSKTPNARNLMEQWIESSDEWIGRAGWHLLGQLAANDATLDDSYFDPYLARIAEAIHSQKNRVREAMNNALIAIGIRNAVLEERATRIAQQIGKVHVDHGETNCKTPDAVAYIRKAWARRTAAKA